nr:hypothetical protein CFP56_62732 [Quercus suber]
MESTEKPFKTIEVTDARTLQACKVACMSCIRGHRTTSCGIPVCRTKIFWTVKRPGRPSNSCTCRYSGGGGCKCVVAVSKVTCPHKSRKGEKRSGECRCDEQGRYCCVLDPEHWTALFALQKPRIEFFPTREALEARTVASTPFTAPATPMYAAPSPQYVYPAPHTPGSMNGAQPVYGGQHPFAGAQPQVASPIRARFQLMGVGDPQSSASAVPDPFTWEEQGPPATLLYNHAQHQEPLPRQEEASSCCQSSSSSMPPQLLSQMPYVLPGQGFDRSTPDVSYVPNAGVAQNSIAAEEQIPSSVLFDYNKMTTDYFNYQLPNAICQNCGLSGCTCKHCPPVLQNFDNGSWAQCCGRKHARTLAPAKSQPPALASAFAQPFQPSEDQSFATTQHSDDLPQFTSDPNVPIELAGMHSPAATSEFTTFDLDHDMSLPMDVSTPLSLSDFLMSDLENPEKNRFMNEGETDLVHPQTCPVQTRSTANVERLSNRDVGHTAETLCRQKPRSQNSDASVDSQAEMTRKVTTFRLTPCPTVARQDLANDILSSYRLERPMLLSPGPDFNEQEKDFSSREESVTMAQENPPTRSSCELKSPASGFFSIRGEPFGPSSCEVNHPALNSSANPPPRS